MKKFDKNRAKKKVEFNKNKSTYFRRLGVSLSCLILILIIMLFTFAKFDSTSLAYTLINGRIKDVSSGDLELAINVDGQSAGTIPENNGNFVLSKLECKDGDGDVEVTYDEKTWAITYILISKKTKCTYTFISKEEWLFAYTGGVQEFTVPKDGRYKVELWGAGQTSTTYNGGYTAGKIDLDKDDVYYIYVGQEGIQGYRGGSYGFNGGGTGRLNDSAGYKYGGGATDMRIVSGSWSDFNSLKSRIMVAGGGCGGAGGGLNGYRASNDSTYGTYANGGSQTGGGVTSNYNGPGASGHASGTAGSFGYGGNGGGAGTASTGNQTGSWGGAGGYYGGGGGTRWGAGTSYGGGGSSFISGHNGCNAISQSSTSGSISHTGQSIHYSELSFTDTVMIDGAGHTWTNSDQGIKSDNLMPNPDGEYYASGSGRNGNGYARITYLGNN